MKVLFGQAWVAWCKIGTDGQYADMKPAILRMKFHPYQPHPSIHVTIEFSPWYELTNDQNSKSCVVRFWLSPGELMLLISQLTKFAVRNLFASRKQ
jgi:hypothetical protein